MVMPIAHLSDRSVVKMSGPDARAFLQGQLTNDIGLLAPEAPLYAGVLSPQGKAMFAILLFADGDDILIDCAADQAEALVKRFTMFRLRRSFTIAAEPGLNVYAGWDGAAGTPDPRYPAGGVRFVAADADAGATLADWHAHRLPLGLPEADEIGVDDCMWLETNGRELNGTSFTKGCYTGQENVARMHHRDKLRKRLLPVKAADGAEGPILSGARAVGELRGVAHGGMRMALIRTDHPGGELLAGGAPVEPLLPPWLDLQDVAVID